MKKFVILLGIFTIILVCFSIVMNPALFFQNITNTLTLWLYKVYPSIFTFYLISSFLINTKILNRIIYYFRFIFKHLRFKNEQILNLFILSIFIGNPSTASLIKEEIKKGNLTTDDGNNLLKYASFTNPLFIIAYLSIYNLRHAFLIMITQILANLLIIIFHNLNNQKTVITRKVVTFKLNEILLSFHNVINLLLMVSSVMVFANILKYSIETILTYFSFSSNITTLVLSIFEISSGLTTIMNLGFDIKTILILISFLISFTGLSIHLQVVNIINEVKLSYFTFFIYRIVQGILSILLLIPIYGIFFP